MFIRTIWNSVTEKSSDLRDLSLALAENTRGNFRTLGTNIFFEIGIHSESALNLLNGMWTCVTDVAWGTSVRDWRASSLRSVECPPKCGSVHEIASRTLCETKTLTRPPENKDPALSETSVSFIYLKYLWHNFYSCQFAWNLTSDFFAQNQVWYCSHSISCIMIQQLFYRSM